MWPQKIISGAGEVEVVPSAWLDDAERRATALAETLTAVIDIHHRTPAGSRKHDPTSREWHDCDCNTCRLAQAAITGGQ